MLPSIRWSKQSAPGGIEVEHGKILHCAGAFVGRDKIVQKRIGQRTMGFNGPTLEVEAALARKPCARGAGICSASG